MAVTVSGFRPIERVERTYQGRVGKPILTVGASDKNSLYARLSKTAMALINGTEKITVLSNGKGGSEAELLLVSDPAGEFGISKTGSLSGVSIAQAIGTAPKPGTKIVFAVSAWSQGTHKGIRASGGHIKE